jgi:hypothetical protein
MMDFCTKVTAANQNEEFKPGSLGIMLACHSRTAVGYARAPKKVPPDDLFLNTLDKKFQSSALGIDHGTACALQHCPPRAQSLRRCLFSACRPNIATTTDTNLMQSMTQSTSGNETSIRQC